MATVLGPLAYPSPSARLRNGLNLTQPNCKVTKLLVTKLLVTKFSSYQIIGYQIVSYQNVNYQIISYQKSVQPSYLHTYIYFTLTGNFIP